MNSPIPRFLRRADAPRSLQALPEKTRLTVLFVNLSTRPMWPEFILSDAEGLETCFASRMKDQALSPRVRCSLQTVNFTFHHRPLPINQHALEKPESRVLFVNFAPRMEVCMTGQARTSRVRFSVQTVNFTFRNRPLLINQHVLEKPEMHVQFVNFTICGLLNGAASIPILTMQLCVQFVNFAPLACARKPIKV